MKTAFFNAKGYDRKYFDEANREGRQDLRYLEAHFNASTAPLAKGHEAVCVFVNDRVDAEALELLRREGVRFVFTRSAGFNHIDLPAAQGAGIRVFRVPDYSPHAVAEHAVGLILSLDRKIHRSYHRVREGNFSLEGLLGFDLHGKTVGVVGLGKIGQAAARILKGFGCGVLAADPFPPPGAESCGARLVPLEALLEQSRIITLHCPLTPGTRHLIRAETIARMRDGVMLVNTSRGAILETEAVIQALKGGKIGALGLDVYEEEAGLFFEDLSETVIQDDVFTRLLTFPNVLITGHQGFFTEEALRAIARTTLDNMEAAARGGPCPNEVTA